jgi:hypothetical protein
MESHEEFFSDKLMDLANFAAVVLIFEQIAKEPIQWMLIFVGAALLLLAIVLSFVLRRQGRKGK